MMKLDQIIQVFKAVSMGDWVGAPAHLPAVVIRVVLADAHGGHRQ
jgi:hypothetical protein